MAHWLDSTCKCCSGTGVKALLGNGICTTCKGAGAAAIHGTAGLELERVKNMVSELSAPFPIPTRAGQADCCAAATGSEKCI